jgi:hypothetical protein
VNVSKAALEAAFVDELALLQPTPGYMRLVKDRILDVWEQRRAEANDRTTEQQRRVSAIQQKTCGSKRRSTTSSGYSSCSFLKESRSTEIGSIEPP